MVKKYDKEKMNILKETADEQDELSLKTERQHVQGKHPNSLANLKPYERGVSGNPGGRPEKFAKLKKALDEWADKEVKYDFWDSPPEEAVTMKEQVLWRIWDKARHGDNKCIELLARLGCLDEKSHRNDTIIP